MKISGNLVDIHKREIYPAEVTFDSQIVSVTRVDDAPGVFILPGLIDAHVHIESSMITPGAFGTEVVRHGTVAVVSDPHEIANVLGMEGIDYMMKDASGSPVRFFFGAPSCVPATDFETSGSRITADDIEQLLQRDEIRYLSEMMNFPGVISENAEIMAKLKIAVKYGKPVDGHAPGLTGNDLRKYIGAGISTDHECNNMEEALEKIGLGMKIQIREGSAARNLDALKRLYEKHPGRIMLCSDDLHPEMLLKGHINLLIARLIREGYDRYDVIRSATLNPSEHYGLEAGTLREGERADLIIVDQPERMNVIETWISGKKVYGENKVKFTYSPGHRINKFICSPLRESDIRIKALSGRMRVIVAMDGELLTGEKIIETDKGSPVVQDTAGDLMKIVVKDRYMDGTPATGFINGFSLKSGALASSVAHDSHNIVAVGAGDADLILAINRVIEMKGGLAVSNEGEVESLPLDIGGIMATRPCAEVAAGYERLNAVVKSMGCRLKAPFMTLSFMPLLVIPDLKIGDRGLFDVKSFSPVSLFINS